MAPAGIRRLWQHRNSLVVQLALLLLGYLLRRSPRLFGFGAQPERGRLPGRIYVSQFVAEHRDLIRGHCLEIRDRGYLDEFGHGVLSAEVLDIDPTNPRATIHGDLQDLAEVRAGTFDCLIVTQTLMYIRDPAAAVAEMFRVLAPGGTALVTVAAIEPCGASARTGGVKLSAIDAWRFMPLSARYLFDDSFGTENVEVRSYGNALTGVAHWLGMVAQDLPEHLLAEHDPQFPVVVAVRATKPRAWVESE